MKKWLFTLFIFVNLTCIRAQSDNLLFDAINNYDTVALTQIIDQKLISDPYLLFLTKCYRDYLEKGIVEDQIEEEIVFKSLQRTLLYTKYQGLLRKKYNPLIHETLLKGKNQNNSSFWRNEIGLTMIQYLILYSQNEQHLILLLKEYMKSIDTSFLSPVDRFRLEQISLDLLMKEKEMKTESQRRSDIRIEKKLVILEAFCPDINYYRGVLEKGRAIYDIEFTGNIERAIVNLKKASSFFDSMKNYFGQKQRANNQNSVGIILRDMGRHAEAITIFQALLDNITIKENAIARFKIHTSLEKCYAALGIAKKAHHHSKIVNRMQDSIYRMRQTEAILEKDYHNKMENLSQKHTTLRVQFQTLIPIAGGLLLMVCVFVWLYKKAQSKKQDLESEKEHTLKEVQALKQLVIKNYIVLKDKTKVYIKDLLYIKAEDHYIQVFTSDGKSHLVRGRLSDLEDQLPPNFVRTHRSYITNRNFIKQIHGTFLLLIEGTEIPISRKFQKDWK